MKRWMTPRKSCGKYLQVRQLVNQPQNQTQTHRPKPIGLMRIICISTCIQRATVTDCVRSPRVCSQYALSSVIAAAVVTSLLLACSSSLMMVRTPWSSCTDRTTSWQYASSYSSSSRYVSIKLYDSDDAARSRSPSTITTHAPVAHHRCQDADPVTSSTPAGSCAGACPASRPTHD